MATRRHAPRSKTTPELQTVNALLTPKEAVVARRVDRPTRARPQLLVKWGGVEPWQQDNHYILSGYRPATYSYAGCFQSLFYLHNESVNIHSHLLGCFLCFFIALSTYFVESHQLEWSDVIVFACFFIGAILCLGMSAIYHLISNHSPEVARFGNQLDYAGIVALITGSFVPSIYYGFYCEPHLQWRYWAMISLIGVGCTEVSINPKFRTPTWRPFRAGMFVAMGLSAIFPVLHEILLFGAEKLQQSVGLFWLVLQGVLYVAGAALYAARIPERFAPGKFDLWGASHQIFHGLILFAVLSHLVGLLTALHYRKQNPYCR